jgi:hypothetical protein
MEGCTGSSFRLSLDSVADVSQLAGELRDAIGLR